MKKDLQFVIGKIGRLSPFEVVRFPNTHRVKWKCLCDCGNVVSVWRSSLCKKGRTRSCGCLNKDNQRKRNMTHGQTPRNGRTKEYRAWLSMKNRCYYPQDHYWKYYGGRGIVVCDEWKNNFIQFFKDMGVCPPKYSLDRIDVNGSYCKENCKWSSSQDQSRNKQKSIKIEYNGQILPLKTVCEQINFPYKIALGRYQKNWPKEDLFIPPRSKRHSLSSYFTSLPSVKN